MQSTNKTLMLFGSIHSTGRGVCRSNLHLIEGDWKKHGMSSTLPVIPGHEVVGIVRKIGDGVKRVKIGDRVGIQPLFSSCLQREYCMSRRENLCKSAGITGESVQGAMLNASWHWKNL
ncbi:MAG: alcohol dehydrogenase catalytic domain-containing protein [Thermoproteota archaeon]|nr:alcohol dehydrogenase catalytic domain-containing protein [Thermoproteota archaeon]